ncbi:hypothetical protein VOLCADRAFT_94016 [Volvox carteri f. nagariensis]|uniref:UVR domain-containing protein n=1 Tax=Volvox carteri f. nagariensis TaxID=3068 RepID=D8U3P3_VOLCA|nr:uncharacterized protein VOLCADRAFT_94016 [Volvox carteri f. nagariensis]EFJ45564.1 hypothetical protein VOLCADRAFT_94016 [Volvox carteri f. nagariensis]|eukprot:XP_002953254.1 hypothetical protein VOLCADRAFT_94016 [Volvox carteri f. nagariensis]
MHTFPHPLPFAHVGQLDLDTQLQRCLNYEAYEAAQEVRKKRQRVDEAVQQMRERKARNTGMPAASTKLGAADFATEGLRLRSEMQRAVEAENYADAAKYRDLLRELETQVKKAAALAAEWDTTTSSSGGPKLRLGQRVLHRQLGYRGVVVGWDSQCCESEDWIAQSKAESLQGGTRQVFYHLLVDARDWEYDAHLPPVAYVAEELLTWPEMESEGGKSWVEVYGNDPLQHPYLYILFLGLDGRGDYVPCRQLRDKYSACTHGQSLQQDNHFSSAIIVCLANNSKSTRATTGQISTSHAHKNGHSTLFTQSAHGNGKSHHVNTAPLEHQQCRGRRHFLFPRLSSALHNTIATQTRRSGCPSSPQGGCRPQRVPQQWAGKTKT